MTPLSVKHLQLKRGGQSLIADLSFDLTASNRLFLQGDIGSGKSSLLLALMGFIPIEKGEIYLFGERCFNEKTFRAFRGTVGLCFQNAEDQLFGPTVLDDVAFGLLNQGVAKAEAYQKALIQLEQLEIAHLKDRSVNQLSGGEKNFTALAGVLAMQPKLLLLDEPTNGLDAKNIAKLTALLKSLQLPMLVASHDLNFSQALANEYIFLGSR